LDLFDITQKVLDVLEQIGARFFVGGSIASSLYGELRYTQAPDIITDLDAERADEVVARLQADFYCNPAAAREAAQRRSSFNLTHFDSQYKIDLFVSKGRRCDESRFARRRIPANMPANFWVASPEDVVLAKLEWFRLGQGLSDRQWRDILSILATQQGQLDEAYLSLWAARLEASDLLEKARQEIQPLL